MKHFFHRLETTENALRLSTILLVLPMFFITDARILCTTDTGAYLQTISNIETQGLAAAIPMDRSVFFGLFLWAGKSYFGIGPLLHQIGIQLPVLPLFALMFLPCVLLMLAATYWLEVLFPQKTVLVIAASLSIAMTLTPLPWFIFQAMPDIFTPLVFLYAMVFLHAKSNATKYLSASIMILSALMHLSNLPILLLFSLGIVGFQYKYKSLSNLPRWHSNRPKQLLLLSLIPWITTILLNLWAGNGVTPSKGSHVFLMGKLCESGILKAYLDKTPLNSNPLTRKHPEIKVFYDNKDHLPHHAWDFVWNEQPLLGPTGGWHHGKDLYLNIYKATLTSPNLLGMHFIAAIKSTLQQVGLNHAGDGLEPLSNHGAVAIELQKHFPKDYEGIFVNHSPQQSSSIDFGWFNQWYDIVAAMLMLIVAVLVWKFPQPHQLPMLGITSYFVLCNAFVTANFANVLSRLNARSFWLIPVICTAIICHAVLQYYVQKKPQSTR